MRRVEHLPRFLAAVGADLEADADDLEVEQHAAVVGLDLDTAADRRHAGHFDLAEERFGRVEDFRFDEGRRQRWVLAGHQVHDIAKHYGVPQ